MSLNSETEGTTVATRQDRFNKLVGEYWRLGRGGGSSADFQKAGDKLASYVAQNAGRVWIRSDVESAVVAEDSVTAERTRTDALAFALRDVLVKAGVLREGDVHSGPQLLSAAEAFAKSESG